MSTLSNELRNINHTFEDRKEKLRRLSLAGEIWIHSFSQETQQQAKDSWQWLKDYCHINLYPATHLIADMLEGEDLHPFFTTHIKQLTMLAIYINTGIGGEVIENSISETSIKLAEQKANKIALEHFMRLE